MGRSDTRCLHAVAILDMVVGVLSLIVAIVMLITGKYAVAVNAVADSALGTVLGALLYYGLSTKRTSYIRYYCIICFVLQAILTVVLIYLFIQCFRGVTKPTVQQVVFAFVILVMWVVLWKVYKCYKKLREEKERTCGAGAEMDPLK